MNRVAFEDAFRAAMAASAEETSRHFGTVFEIEAVTIVLHGAGVSGAEMSVEEAIERTYLSPGSFYRVIDVSLLRLVGSRAFYFVRASGHPPGSFAQTWGGASGDAMGPFKTMIHQDFAWGES